MARTLQYRENYHIQGKGYIAFTYLGWKALELQDSYFLKCSSRKTRLRREAKSGGITASSRVSVREGVEVRDVAEVRLSLNNTSGLCLAKGLQPRSRHLGAAGQVPWGK